MRRGVVVAIAACVAVAAGSGGATAIWENGTLFSQCSAATLLGAVNNTTTPYLTVDSPYLGFANGTYTVFHNTSSAVVEDQSSVAATGGSISYLSQGANWTVSSDRQTGFSSRSCAGTLTVGESSRSLFTGQGTSGPFVNDSDAPRWGGNETGFSEVYVNDTFARAQLGLSTCAGGAVTLGTTSTYLDIGIPYRHDGTGQVATATLQVLTNYTYTFPGGAGSWAIDELSAPGGPGGGWSFAYLGGCPAVSD
jgi:hypothetical protein